MGQEHREARRQLSLPGRMLWKEEAACGAVAVAADAAADEHAVRWQQA
jgi:hypothetical protein